MTRIEFYNMAKAKHEGCIILMRCGDFYETMEDDAVAVAEILGIIITKQGKNRMAGFPAHALDEYLPRLVRAGKRIAICDEPEYDKPCIQLWQRIAPLRKSQGMTQEQLAEAVGTNQFHISRIESGMISPSIELLEKIAKACGKRVDFVD